MMELSTKEDFLKAHDISGQEHYELKCDLFNATAINFYKEVIPIATCIQILTGSKCTTYGYSHLGNILTKTDFNKKKLKFKEDEYIVELDIQAYVIYVLINSAKTFSFHFYKPNDAVCIRLCDFHPLWKSHELGINFTELTERHNKCVAFLRILGFNI